MGVLLCMCESGAILCTQHATLHRRSHYVFPEKELRGFSPSFHIHVSVSDLYIPRFGPHIFLQQNRLTDPREYTNRSRTHVFKNWGLTPRNSFPENICFEFSVLCLCSVLVSKYEPATLYNEQYMETTKMTFPLHSSSIIFGLIISSDSERNYGEIYGILSSYKPRQRGCPS